MSTIALELAITRSGDTYAATLTARQPGADACLAAEVPVTIDVEALRALELTPEVYGAALSAMVFPQPLREAWARARGAGEGQQRPLRLGLALAAGDDALHALLWETLRDPLSGLPLARGEAVRLVRLLPSASLADLTPPPRPALRAVVAASAAAPPGAPPVDRAGLTAAALDGLADIPAALLDGREGRPAATLANLTAALRDGAPLLVLICHGALVAGEPYLWLDQAGEGPYRPVSGAAFVEALAQLGRMPLLVVLAACQGGGDSYAALRAVGPRLAQAGVGAVLAMRARIPQATVAALLPSLFAELRRDGEVDRALAAARAALDAGHPWWLPVLWLRARDGRLWREEAPAPPPAPLDPAALLEAMPIADDAPIPPADQVALGAVPHRIELLPNELFTGRDHELRTLARQLKAGRNTVVTTGMGGVGKTQLASEFAYRYGRYFAGGVFWIDCSVPERVPAEIAAGGGPGGLDLPGFADLSDEERVDRVKEAWKQSIPRLLIFDNCEDEKLLRDHQPGPGGCRVLVTSRRQQWSPGQNLTPLDLDVLERRFGIDLLRKLANPNRKDPISIEQANQIAEELGDLPLALHLAGSYLAQYPSTSPEAFLAEVREKRLEQPALANEDELYVPTLEAQRRASSLYAVLTIGLERLDPGDASGALARTLLARATCLEPPGVTFPRDLLSRTAPIAGDNPEHLRLVDQALNLLINLGFLDLEVGGRLRMHRLIVSAVRQARIADDPLTTFAPAALSYCLDLITRADSKITSGQIVEGRAELDQDQALWIQFLDWSYNHEPGGTGISPGARATALLGNYWKLTGATGKEETLARLRQALGLARRAEDRQAQANVLKARGDVQQFRDDRDAALQSYEAALALYRQVGDRLGEANVLKARGDVQQFRKEMDAALQSYEAALALYRQVGAKLGEANVLAALSRLLIDSDPPASQALLQQALAIRESINDAYNMGADLGNYGIALLQRGRNAEALPYLERARELFISRGITEVIPQTDALIAQARGGGGPAPDALADLPEPIRQALEARDGAALQAALEALPEDERRAVIERLQAAGIIGRGPDMAGGVR